MDGYSNRIFILNSIACRIFVGMMNEQTVREIALSIVAEGVTMASVQHDIKAFIKELSRIGLLHIWLQTFNHFMIIARW